jgi:hypothetical protein
MLLQCIAKSFNKICPKISKILEGAMGLWGICDFLTNVCMYDV